VRVKLLGTLDRTELEKLSSKELHDRAMSLAVRHFDIGWLWDVVKAIPPARAAAGELSTAEVDVVSLSSTISDVIHADEGKLADALRPMYIEYLAKNG
jgi:hypothetical protein